MRLVLALITGTLVLAACGQQQQADAPAIPFAPLVDTSVKDPDNPDQNVSARLRPR